MFYDNKSYTTAIKVFKKHKLLKEAGFVSIDRWLGGWLKANYLKGLNRIKKSHHRRSILNCDKYKLFGDRPVIYYSKHESKIRYNKIRHWLERPRRFLIVNNMQEFKALKRFEVWR